MVHGLRGAHGAFPSAYGRFAAVLSASSVYKNRFWQLLAPSSYILFVAFLENVFYN